MTERTDLIARLEAAPTGSRELDIAIEAALGEPRKHYANGTRARRPRFSQSLDAALPDEDIIMVSEQDGPHPRKWTALNRFPPGVYGHSAIAHTEPLARRAAAMKAMP